MHVIHDNPDWFPALRAAFDADGVPVEEVLLGSGQLSLDAEPAPGVYWSRLSASAHTRGRGFAKEQARTLLSWLDAHGATVVNGRGVLELEVSKAAQHALLRRHGIAVPQTTAVFGTAGLVDAAAAFSAPFMVKHNQGGKGLGVRRFDTHEELGRAVAAGELEDSVDGVLLVQELLAAREPFVTRVEFVGGSFLYAVRVDTSEGSFELCPAEACAVPTGGPAVAPFAIRPEVTAADPLVVQLTAALADAGIAVAGVEFIETVDGRRVVYDVNTNTNYNPDVEAGLDVSGARQVARYLGGLLDAA